MTQPARRPRSRSVPRGHSLAFLGERGDKGRARQVLAYLKGARKIAILGHEHPDGDCVGSTVALCAALRGQGYAAHVVFGEPLPQRYRFLDTDTYVRLAAPQEPLGADVVFILDTTDFGRLGGARPEAFAGATVLNIDHHMTNAQFGAFNWVEAQAAAVGELIWRLLSAARWRVPPVALEALYVALMTDTGQFAFSNTTPRILRMAAELLQAGVDPETMWRRIYLNKTPGELELESRARDSFDVWAEGKIAVISLTHEDFLATKTTAAAAQEFANIPRALEGSVMALFFYEVEEGQRTKVSIRCKRELNASDLAQEFGGGGHRQAAGCRLDVPLREAQARFRPAAERAVRQTCEPETPRKA